MNESLNISFIDKDALLLKRFNNRDKQAFGRVYVLYYNELHMYATYIFRDTSESAEDIIQDIFFRIWENKHVVFDTLVKIKAFIYVSIKNAYKNHLKHLGHQNRYIDAIDLESTYDIIECEIFTTLDEALQLLPKEYAVILRMYLEDYKPEEISEFLGYKVRTVYNKKQLAISILKDKFPSDKILLLISFNSILIVT